MFESASVAWVVESLPWHWQGDTRLLATKCIFVLQDGLPRSILYRSSLDPCKYSIEWLFENDLKKSSFDAGNGSYWIFYSFAQKKNYNQNMFLNMIHVQYYTLICVFCDIILQYHSIYPWMPRKKIIPNFVRWGIPNCFSRVNIWTHWNRYGNLARRLDGGHVVAFLYQGSSTKVVAFPGPVWWQLGPKFRGKSSPSSPGIDSPKQRRSRKIFGDEGSAGGAALWIAMLICVKSS